MKRHADDHDSHLVIPYLTGVYLAVNAIPDAYLLVDGPNCVFFRTAQIQGNHDWQSTLASCTGLHRVADSDCTTMRAAAGDQAFLLSRLSKMSSIQDCAVILLTAMSPAAVTGPQYDKVIRDLGAKLTKPVIQVRAGSLSGDWLHGYAWTLEDLATRIELEPAASLHDDEVAIVGYLMDRNEADHTANLSELGRLLEGLGLKLIVSWLDGSGFEDLKRISRAGSILSFPYARAAAEVLARRTGARLVRCDLPMGLGGTIAWIRNVAGALGIEDRADALIDRELGQTVPRLEWILPHSLLNKNLVIAGDPHLASSLSDMATELGCRVSLLVYWAQAAHIEEREGSRENLRILQSVEPQATTEEIRIPEPRMAEIEQSMHTLHRRGPIDLIIANSRALMTLVNTARGVPFVELGFPSYHTHALADSPCLGFKGTLRMVERMANAMGQCALHQERRQ